MEKTPTHREAEEELGPDAMSFFMDMIRQDDTPDDDEEETQCESD
jgi:hypothetical protein